MVWRTRPPSAVVVESTRYGCATSPPFATAAATIAIWSGVAFVSYWPMEDSASWSGDMPVSTLERATREGMRRSGSLKPNDRAVSSIRRSPVLTPSAAITVLHDQRMA